MHPESLPACKNPMDPKYGRTPLPMHGPLRSASITRMGAEKSFIATVAVMSVSWMARPVNWRIPCRSVMASSRLRRLCMIIIWSLEPETARSGESSYSKLAVSNLRAVLHYAVLLLKALLLGTE